MADLYSGQKPMCVPQRIDRKEVCQEASVSNLGVTRATTLSSRLLVNSTWYYIGRACNTDAHILHASYTRGGKAVRATADKSILIVYAHHALATAVTFCSPQWGIYAGHDVI